MISLRWFAAPFLALVIAFGLACGGDSDNGNGDPGTNGGPVEPTGAQTTGAQPTGAQPTGAQPTGPATGTLDTGAIGSSMAEIESFRFTMRMSFDIDADGAGPDSEAAMAAMFMAMMGNLELEGAYVAPDRFMMGTSFFGMRFESIQIGDEAWINEGSGWVPDDMAAGGFDLGFDFASPSDLPFAFLPETALTGATTSSETVNGVETTRYSFDRNALQALLESTDDIAGLGDLDDFGEIDSMTLDIWMTEGGIPVRLRMEMAASEDDLDFSIVVEFNITDVNDPSISIERPI